MNIIPFKVNKISYYGVNKQYLYACHLTLDARGQYDTDLIQFQLYLSSEEINELLQSVPSVIKQTSSLHTHPYLSLIIDEHRHVVQKQELIISKRPDDTIHFQFVLNQDAYEDLMLHKILLAEHALKNVRQIVCVLNKYELESHYLQLKLTNK